MVECAHFCLHVAARSVDRMKNEKRETGDTERATPIVSSRSGSGAIIEMVHRRESGEVRLAVWRDEKVSEEKTVVLDGREYRPYSAGNNLLTHRVILLPSKAEDCGSEADLLETIRTFIHRHVDVSAAFEEVCAHYVLLTWVFDAFNELPYLRVRGDYGSGKSRFLLTVGSISYKPIFASGASTVSPLFRLIDEIGGTLVVDEADFYVSDERTEIVKILNNGNARGFPVLRSEMTPSKEFSPRAFNIFGPKVIATRHPFQDMALESRCLTEALGNRPPRRDIPISLPHSFDYEAEVLRNRLLMYRFRRLKAFIERPLSPEPGLPPRRAQILAPLLAVSVSNDSKTRLRAFIEEDTSFDRSGAYEASKNLLSTVQALLAEKVQILSLKAIAVRFSEQWGETYPVEAGSRWVGALLRRLGVEPHKSHGIYIVPTEEYPRLRTLMTEYGVGDVGEQGDVHSASRVSV